MKEETGGQQVPWENGSIEGEFYFNNSDVSPAVPPISQQKPTMDPAVAKLPESSRPNQPPVTVPPALPSTTGGTQGPELKVQEPEIKVKANLMGAAEVPGPGDNNGSGTVQVTLVPDKNEVCYDLSLTKLDDATAAHIHEGAAGKTGPPRVPLGDSLRGGTARGCKFVDAAVIKSIMANPANYYVNVHSAAHPNGAVRGQLSK